MNTYRLNRTPNKGMGLFGTMEANGFLYQTLDHGETPDGTYHCQYTYSKELSELHGEETWAYILLDVPGHTGIRIHSGNFASLLPPPMQSDSLGCFLVAFSKGKLKNQYGVMQDAVLGSRAALKQFNLQMGKEDFWLEVKTVA